MCWILLDPRFFSFSGTSPTVRMRIRLELHRNINIILALHSARILRSQVNSREIGENPRLMLQSFNSKTQKSGTHTRCDLLISGRDPASEFREFRLSAWVRRVGDGDLSLFRTHARSDTVSVASHFSTLSTLFDTFDSVASHFSNETTGEIARAPPEGRFRDDRCAKSPRWPRLLSFEIDCCSAACVVTHRFGHRNAQRNPRSTVAAFHAVPPHARRNYHAPSHREGLAQGVTRHRNSRDFAVT